MCCCFRACLVRVQWPSRVIPEGFTDGLKPLKQLCLLQQMELDTNELCKIRTAAVNRGISDV